MKVTVCIGSTCHIKGARQVVDELQYLITQNHLTDQVKLHGAFCLGRCQDAVCVSIQDQYFSVAPDTVAEFFEKEIKAKL